MNSEDVIPNGLTKIFFRHPGAFMVVLATAVTFLLISFYLYTELRLTNGELGVPLDDAWIHYQFARNLSQGDGFSFNPGKPTPGSTAPLWTLLLATVGLFTKDFLIPSLALSAGFLLAAVGLTYGFTYSLTQSQLPAVLAALGAALSGRLLWAGLAGMETTAFAAFSIAAVWMYTRQGLRPAPALLFGLASQARPEGHALFALAVIDSLWVIHRKMAANRQPLAGMIKPLAMAGLFYGVVAMPYAAFSLATTGRPLPNTFYAKVGSEHLFSWRTLGETIRLHWLDNPASLLFGLAGLHSVWRRSRLAVLWLLGLPLLTAVLVDLVWHHGRYTMPLIPFQMMTAAVGIHWFYERLTTRSGKTTFLKRYSSTIMVMLGLFFLVAGLWRTPFWASMLGNNVKEILEIDVALGHWLADNTPPDALIAVDDIGAITFLSQRRIVDMNGLVSPEMWPAVRAPTGLPRNQIATRILSTIAPDYMVGFPLWHWEIATNTAVSKPIHRVQTATHTIIAEQEVVVYQMSWPYLNQASPQVPMNVRLNNTFELLGYDWVAGTGGQPLDITLYWQSLVANTAAYDVFIHLLNDENQIVTQVDQKPVHGLASTNLWQPGDIIRDPYRMNLPPDLPAGNYTVNVGMYLRETGERLLVDHSNAINNAIVLITFYWEP